MTTATDFVRDFQGAVRAGFTLVSVVTSEEARARELVALACKGMPVVYWTAASGTKLADALEHATTSNAKEVHVLVDPQPHLGDPLVQRVLREVGLGARRALVVFLGSAIDLPPDVERETANVDLPLPTRDELGALLDPMIGEGWDRGAFVRAAAGLTMTEAARATRR